MSPADARGANPRPEGARRRVAVVYNPVSGTGTGRGAAVRVADACSRRGHVVELVPTRADVAVAETVRAAADGNADRLIVIGGDGTVTEAGAGMLESSRPVPLAIVPQGTANILALNLGIPRDTEDAIDVALGDRVVEIDVGRVNGEVFLLTIGTGLHAEMVARADREAKQRWGLAAYGIAGVQATRETRPVPHVLTLDGATEEVDATMVQVMNCGAVLRRSWECAPGVSPVDGLLDVIAYRAASIPEYLTAVAHIVRGAPTDTELVVHRRARTVRIETDPPVGIQRDGEQAGTTPASIEVAPRALPMVVGPDNPWSS